MYLNNAATTWPKPEIVYETVDDCFRTMNSPGRSISEEGERSCAVMNNCRAEVAEFLGIQDPSRLVFTPSCTYASNLAIQGLRWQPGDVAIMSGLEHHAVSRPIRKVSREHGIEFQVAPYAPDQPIDFDFVEQQLKTGKVKLVACTMAANVTGDIFPSKQLGELVKSYGALYLVDAAQSAGVLPVNVNDLHADMLTVAGHKGMFGPPGVGCLFVREGIELNSLAEGGTGRDSGKHDMSERFPSNYEVGTHNLLSIVGLTAGVRWVHQAGLDNIRAHEEALATRFIEGLRQRDDVTIYGTTEMSRRSSVVSVTFEQISPQEMAVWLAENHQIATRPGYHCAPLAHETIGTLPGDGTLRFSFGYFNTLDEVDQLLGIMADAPTTAAAA
ncbi:MAG: aminotransferase class V-fold PLP-dependent enzyme [Planctomycetota bacterium]